MRDGKTQYGKGPHGVFEAQNFQIQLPDEGWVELDASKINPEITAWYQNRREKLNLMVIAEPLGVDFDDLSPFEEVVRTTFTSQMDSAEMSDFRHAKVGGRIVRRMEVSGLFGVNQIDYRVHLFQENGVLYQVNVMQMGRHNLRALNERVDELVGSFSIIDKDFYPGMDESLRQRAIDEPRLGFALDLSDSSWMQWDELELDAPFLLNAALWRQTGVLGVAGLWGVAEEEVPSVLVSAFLHANDIDFESLEDVTTRNVRVSDVDGKEYRFVLDGDDEPVSYCVRVFQIDTVAIGLLGWWTDSNTEVTVVSAMDRMVIDPAQIQTNFIGDEVWKAAQGNLLNGAGLSHYVASRYVNAMDYFMSSFDRDPSEAVVLGNVAHAAANSGDYSTAIEFIGPRIEAHAEDQELSVAYSLILAYNGDVESALEHAMRAYEAGYVDDSDLLSLINEFIDADAYEAAIELNKASFVKAPSAKREAWLASVLRLSGDLDGAQEWLDSTRERHGNTSLIAEEQASIYAARGEWRETLSAVESWVEEYGASVDAYEQEISAQIGLDWLADAKETAKEALGEFPGNEALLDSQRWILSRIGEDDLNLVREPIEPLEMPDAIAEVVAAAVERELPEHFLDKSSVYDYRVTGYSFDREALFRRGYRARVQIGDRSAMEDFGTLQFEFDRSYERLYVNYIRVLGEDGQVVWEQNRDSFYISENSDDEMATDSVTLYAPVAALSVGATLEWECTWESNTIEDVFPFKSHVFASTRPTKNRTVYIMGDVDEVLTKSVDVPVLSEDEKDLVAWSIDDLQYFRWEQYMPELVTFLPHIRLSDADQTWEALIASYHEEIEDFLKPDEAIREIVAGMDLDGLDTSEKVAKLVREIQDQVIYKALEFGSRGRIPELAFDTWQNRYGDCKDQTILMLQMLAAAGIESYPFLVSTDQALVEEMPSLDQFNHMILYVPALNEQPFIDVVDANFDFSYGAPSGLGGRKGLVVLPEAARVEAIPEYRLDLDQPIANIRSQISMGEGGSSFEVVETLELQGYYAMWMRNHFLGIERGERSDEVKDYVDSFLPENGAFNRADLVNLEATSEPLRIDVGYTIPRVADEPLIDDFRPLWEQYYLDMEPSFGRQNPYRLHYPFSLRSEVAFSSDELIARYVADESISDGSIEPFQFDRLEGPFEGESSDRPKVDSVFRITIAWPERTMDAADYDEFFRILKKLKKQSARSIEVKESERAQLHL